MNEFTASNGAVVRWAAMSGCVHRLTIGPQPVELDLSEWQALREFFQAEADERLARWRDPENPERVVYRKGGEALHVLDETDGDYWSVRIRDIEECSDTHPVSSTARAWAAAHPEPNPEALMLQVQRVGDHEWQTVAEWPVWDEDVRGAARTKLFMFDAMDIPARLGTAKDLS